MKCKVTRKEIRNNYYYILGIGYGKAQFLLKFEEPFGYATRIEGWAFDAYQIDQVCVTTGYAPMNDKHVKCDYQLVRDYDNIARDIIEGNDEDWEVKKEKVTKVLKEFIKQIKE